MRKVEAINDLMKIVQDSNSDYTEADIEYKGQMYRMQGGKHASGFGLVRKLPRKAKSVIAVPNDDHTKWNFLSGGFNGEERRIDYCEGEHNALDKAAWICDQLAKRAEREAKQNI